MAERAFLDPRNEKRLSYLGTGFRWDFPAGTGQRKFDLGQRSGGVTPIPSLATKGGRRVVSMVSEEVAKRSHVKLFVVAHSASSARREVRRVTVPRALPLEPPLSLTNLLEISATFLGPGRRGTSV